MSIHNLYKMEDSVSLEFDPLKVSIITKLEKINRTSSNSTSFYDKRVHCDTNLLSNRPKSYKSDSLPENSSASFQHLLKSVELQRRKSVVNNVQARLKKFEDFTTNQEVNRQKQWLKKQQEFINEEQQKEHTIFQALDEFDKNSSNSHAQLILHYKNLELRRQSDQNEIKKKEQERQNIYKCIDSIKKLQLDFRSSYEQIVQTLKTCTKPEELKTLLVEDIKSLKILTVGFEEVVNKCKNVKVTEDDVGKAQNLIVLLQNLEKKVKETVDGINKRNESEKTVKVSPAPVESNKESDKVPTQKNLATFNKFISSENLKIYVKLMDYYEKHSERFQNLEKDSSQKLFILNCKKAINIPVNSLSGVNSEHILDKYNKLYQLLKGQDVVIGDKKLNASSHPEGIHFCMNLLAKRFILQSDLIISSNPESAFCYATVIMSLWNEFPEFGQLLLAYFYKICPYLVPYNVPKQIGESDEDYYKRQGYQYYDGQIEKQDKYLKRMTGVMRLYTAIMIVKPKRGHVNLYNIQQGWKWLASTLKLEPQVDITTTLVHTFLETAGFEMESCYRKLFKKLVRLIIEKLLPSCREKCSGGAVTRLEVLIAEYCQKNKFETPDGYLGYTYW